MAVYCPLAVKFDLLDKPDENRKLQNGAIPVAGGVVIFCVTFVLAALLATVFSPPPPTSLLTRNTLLPLFFSCSLIVAVGLIDDSKGMKGKTKLLFQIVAASIVISFAGAYSKISLFGTVFDLGHFFYPIGVLWLIGMVNSVNLLDGADGVATTVGFVMSVTAGILALLNGYIVLFVAAIIFSGSLLGFFAVNRPPAKVYLGDTGSMLIGFVVAVLLLRACATDRFVIHAVPPMAVALIPILDSCFAVIRRKNSGRSIFAPDRGHIHHRLLNKVGPGYKPLGILALLTLPGCAGAIAGMYWNNDWLPLIAILCTISLAAWTGLFGREELYLIVNRIVNRLRKRIRHKEYEKSGEVFHFQGQAPWQSLWEDLISTLRKSGCVKAHLDISIPFLHEDFSSDWENMDYRDKEEVYLKCTLPLDYRKQNVGKLKLAFSVQKMSNSSVLYETSELSELCMKYIVDYIKLHQGKTLPSSKPHFIGSRKRKLTKSNV
jgi:UDP-N-acetylmuramyl pentapeptide phosphotransferase/UDP-N-acetylglucosamine-1-phosphate transferase